VKIQRLIKAASKEAAKSSHNYKLGAVIVKHGKIISRGYNKTNRGHSSNYGHWSGSLHAELAAIIAARTDLKGSSILVTRTGETLAKPCECCMAAIKESGIKWVYYTTGAGVDKEKVV
jgi:deoxycytidylate deaminase